MGSGVVGHHPVQAAEDRLQAGHPPRELLRHRVGGVPQRLLRRGVGRLRPGHGHRRGEAEGHRVLRARPASGRWATGPTRPCRHRPPSPSSPRPTADKYGVDPERDEGGDDPHRLEEPPQRRRQPPRPVPQGGLQGDHHRGRRWWPASSACLDCSGVSDGSAAAIICRAEDAHRYTDHPLYVKALCFVAGPGGGPIDPTTTTPPSPRWSARPRTPTGRPGSPTPGRRWPWPRCTTASRRPSWS